MEPDLRHTNLISSSSAREEKGGSMKWHPELKNHFGCYLHQNESRRSGSHAFPRWFRCWCGTLLLPNMQVWK